MDFANMKVKKLAVVTDKNLAKTPTMKMVLDSLSQSEVNFEVFDDVLIEPTDVSFQRAIDWAKKGNFDSYLAVGEWSKRLDGCFTKAYKFNLVVLTTLHVYHFIKNMLKSELENFATAKKIKEV